jgi:hypothetical protein
MKKNIIYSSVIIVLGLLIALGPQFLFKVCDPAMVSTEDADDCCTVPEESGCCTSTAASIPVCHWSARGEIGVGLLIVALGICILVFTDFKTQLGLAIGVFFTAIVALFIPHILIGGCSSIAMACHKVAFPALTVESIILLIFSLFIVVYSEKNFCD